MRRCLGIIVAALIIAVSAPAAAGGKATAAYERAKACYHELLGPSGKTATRKAWEGCIAQFLRVPALRPTGDEAAAALFSAARLRLALYEIGRDSADADAAIKLLNRVIHDAPESTLADDALYRIGCVRRDVFREPDRAAHAFRYLLENYPKGDMAPVAKEALALMGVSTEAPAEPAAEEPAAGGAPKPAAPAAAVAPQAEGTGASAFAGATLIKAEVEPGADLTTVRLTFNRETDYTAEYTESGARTGSPPRLELTLLHTVPARDLEREQDVESGYLLSYEIKRRALSGGLRISFVLPPDAAYDIRRDKGLMVIRFGSREALGKKGKAAPPAGGKAPARGERGALRIVVDPGHGGTEEGAVGPGGLLEKDVTLALSRRLARELSSKLGAKVFLTRDDDRTLSLEERDAIAVSKRADLFISVHVNAAEDRSQSGVETYYLNNATDEAATRLAQRENRTSGKQLSDVEHIISTMLQNMDTEDSHEMAAHVQERLTAKLARFQPGGRVHDRGVRAALFYVLVGAKCPAILVEASFISNAREEKLLRDARYQSQVAEAIAEGVGRYVKARGQQMVSL